MTTKQLFHTLDARIYSALIIRDNWSFLPSIHVGFRVLINYLDRAMLTLLTPVCPSLLRAALKRASYSESLLLGLHSTCGFFSSLVFRMVESEEEYVDQLEILISCFLRPFKMAASSKNPPCTHEDINSIFLNAETVLFLHQIFLKGLTARMESWPTLVLGTSLGGTI